MDCAIRLIADVGNRSRFCGRPLAAHSFRAIVAQQGAAARAASSRSKKRAAAPNAPRKKPDLGVGPALDLVKNSARAKFDETVEIAMVLNVDPRKANENVRGAVQLPKGSGKKVRVAVFARGDDAAAATDAGADIVGAEDLLESVLEGNIDFDKCIATPELMALVGRAGRVLGPRGLMPNPKVGSVTKDVAAAIQAAKAGQAQFRAGKNGVMHVPVGKVSFEVSDLLDNVRATMVAVSNHKPEVVRGTYIKQVHFSSTMGKGVRVDVGTVDPSSSRFMLVEQDASDLVEKALLAQASPGGSGEAVAQAS